MPKKRKAGLWMVVLVALAVMAGSVYGEMITKSSSCGEEGTVSCPPECAEHGVECTTSSCSLPQSYHINCGPPSSGSGCEGTYDENSDLSKGFCASFCTQQSNLEFIECSQENCVASGGSDSSCCCNDMVCYYEGVKKICTYEVISCTDSDNDGYSKEGGECGIVDCDDSDSSINPDSSEICDGIDNDCDGQVDEGFDQDGDGFTTCEGDCDDTATNVNPGVAEVCGNGIDDDCDGETDETCEEESSGGGDAAFLVRFNLQLSEGADSEIALYGWSFGDGATYTTEDFSEADGKLHAYTMPGEHDYSLTVVDNEGGYQRMEDTITIEPFSHGHACAYDEQCSSGYCSSAGACVAPPECGNDKVDDGEECDDGNTQSGDGCSADCTLEAAECGNGIIEDGEECDDDNNENYDGCDSECMGESIAFITSQTYSGDLGGLSGADKKCQGLADNAGLHGTYKAWLSDSSTAVKDRFSHSSRPYYRVDGEKIADNWEDLTTCDDPYNCIDAPIQIDENGDNVYIEEVFTYTKSDGSINDETHVGECDGWTYGANQPPEDRLETYGANSHSTGEKWTRYADNHRCDWYARLYCFSQVEGSASAPTQECGDGVVDEGEECDDGNAQSGDGCDSNCNVESDCEAVSAGDGKSCEDACDETGKECSQVCQDGSCSTDTYACGFLDEGDKECICC